jgi:hypothetical protein
VGRVEPPIRAELFGIEPLEQHADSLAAAQAVLGAPARGRPLLPRVRDNGRVLRESYRVIAEAIRQERVITPAAEWLVDNFHVVDEQLREIHDDLPAGYYRTLPKLADGPLAGHPRVYGLAWAFVAHTDSRLDPDTLRRFVRASSPTGRCGPRADRLGRQVDGPTALWAHGISGDLPIVVVRSTSPRTRGSCGNCSGRTSTGGPSSSRSTWSS